MASSSGRTDDEAEWTCESLDQKRLEEYEQSRSWKRLHFSKAKLKGVTELAALMSGFSVVAMVELDINETDGSKVTFVILFCMTTALLVSTTMLSIMIATCLLPHIDSLVKSDSATLIKQSPHESLNHYVDLAWFLANTASIGLFMLDIILLSWIKFHRTEAICATGIMIPVLVLLFLFSIIFYRQSVQHQINIFNQRYKELEAVTVRLTDQHGESQSSYFKTMGFTEIELNSIQNSSAPSTHTLNNL